MASGLLSSHASTANDKVRFISFVTLVQVARHNTHNVHNARFHSACQNRSREAVQQAGEDRSRLVRRGLQGHRQTGQLGGGHQDH